MIQSALFQQGLSKVKQNDHKGAVAIFTKLLENDPKNADALSQRAVAYLNLEEYELSMIDMNLAIEYDPNYAYRYQCRGYLKARLKDHEGAVADYEKAVQLDPSDGIAYNNLALAQDQLGYAKQAKVNYKKSDQIMGIKPREIENADLPKEKPSVQPQSLEKASDSAANPHDKKSIIKAVFTTKTAFKDFIQFIRNGFKLTNNDKS